MAAKKKSAKKKGEKPKDEAIGKLVKPTENAVKAFEALAVSPPHKEDVLVQYETKTHTVYKLKAKPGQGHKKVCIPK